MVSEFDSGKVEKKEKKSSRKTTKRASVDKGDGFKAAGSKVRRSSVDKAKTKSKDSKEDGADADTKGEPKTESDKL